MRQGIVDKLQLTGFLHDYIEFAKTITDAPVEFHLGAGLTALATVCGSKIVYPGFGGRAAWTNLYTLLIAPSGLFRKSTSVGITEDLVTEVDINMVLTGEQSREKFLALLKEHPNVLYPISEFSSVLSMWNRDYSQGFREIVTDLYDNRREYVRQTLKDGRISIKEPSLNILAASTIDWLRDKLTEGDLHGGLMGRFIIIPGGVKSEDHGLNPSIDDSRRKNLIAFLKSVRLAQKGWVDINSQLSIFNKWVKEIEHEMMRNPNPELVGFQSRLASHCLKLSVLFCVAEFGPQTRYILGSDHLSKGITLATWLHKQATELAETGFIKSKFEQQIQRFLTLCGKPGGISRKEAMRSLHLSMRDFDNLVGTARERGEIEIDTQKTETKNKTVYHLAKEDV